MRVRANRHAKRVKRHLRRAKCAPGERREEEEEEDDEDDDDDCFEIGMGT